MKTKGQAIGPIELNCELTEKITTFRESHSWVSPNGQPGTRGFEGFNKYSFIITEPVKYTLNKDEIVLDFNGFKIKGYITSQRMQRG